MMLAITSIQNTAFTVPHVPAVRNARATPARMAEVVDMDETVLAKYMSLPVTGKVQAEYIFIDADGDVRSKCRTVDAKKATVAQLPEWNYDGSSTNQAPGEDSEVIIRPVAMYPDPFRGGNNKLVICETFTPEGVALPTNTRKPA